MNDGPRFLLSPLFLLLSLAVATGCSTEPEKKPAPKAKTKEKKSNVKRIVTAVPAGKQIACADLLPDITKFKELVAADIGSVADQGKSNPEAAASCAFVRAGEPPTSDKQLKKLKAGNAKLGVLPGDVYCKVTLFCSLSTDEADFKAKCKAKAKKQEKMGGSLIYEGNSDLGQFACVRKADRPPSSWSYTYRTIDSDTRCIVEVIGGPSVTDEELIQNCTRASLQTIGMANLKAQK